MFWVISVFLFLLAAFFVIVPLWLRTQHSAELSLELRKNANIALFHERSDELEADLSAGNIDQTQFDSLLLELQQKLLADVNAEGGEINDGAGSKVAAKKQGKKGKQAVTSEASRWLNRTTVVPIALALLIPLLAYPLYNQWGYFDDVQVMDLFEATVNNDGDPQEAQRLIISIGEFAQENPEMPWAMYFLAENFASLGMFTEAEIAYSRAADLLEPAAEKALVLGRVATAMYINAEFQFTDEILAVINQARELNPGEMSILQLLAADAEQRQDYAAAIEYWRLLIQASPNSEMAQELRTRIVAAQRVLAADGVAAVDGPSIAINLSLSDEIALDPAMRVFIAARNAEREGMPPLAAIDTTVGALPTVFRLDNSSAVGPFNLSSAETVYVSALVSFAGVASPNSGDFRVVSENFAVTDGEIEIDLTISEQVP